MRTSGNNSVGRATRLRQIALALIVFPPIPLLMTPSALCQADSRPLSSIEALSSRSAAVFLVATLESLAVTAAPQALPVPGPLDGTTQLLTIRTSWTLRAQCTTLRLTAFPVLQTTAQDQREAAIGPFALDSPDLRNSSESRLAGAAVMEEQQGAQITQPVGPTSYPGSRTDNIPLVINAGDKTSTESGDPRFLVVIQAL